MSAFVDAVEGHTDGEDVAPWWNPEAVGESSIGDPKRYVRRTDLRAGLFPTFPAGSVVIVTIGSVGRVSLTPMPGVGNEQMTCLVPNADCDPRFLRYALLAIRQQMEAAASTVTIAYLSTENLLQLSVPSPAVDEQRRIADFLDNEIGHLDRARGLREQQAELEGARFKTLLSDAFSNPENQQPLKRSAWWVEGPGIMAAEFRDEGTPVIRLAGVKADTVTLDGCNYVDPNTARARWAHLAVRGGELLVSGSGGVRFPVVVPPEVEGSIPYTGLIRVGPREGASRSYLRFFLGSPWFGQQIDQLKTGVGIQHWGPSHLAQVTLPSVDESAQRRTVAMLAEAEQRQHRIVGSLVKHQSLLEERKQALITAAVTGQFDVTTARAVA